MKLFRKIAMLASVFTLGALSTPSWALNSKDFTADSFVKDRDSGATIIVDVYADWCPTCKKQKGDLSSLLGSEAYKSVILYKLNYDKKDLVQSFSKLINKPIPRQSTIAVFKNKKLTEFSVAQTGETLKAQLVKAMQN